MSGALMELPPCLSTAYRAPGNLGSPNMGLMHEPRVNRRLLEMLMAFELHRNTPNHSLTSLTASSSVAEIAASIAELQDRLTALYQGLPNDLLSDEYELEVQTEEHMIPGPDGQQIRLHFFRPAIQKGPLPCVVYFHGGMMVMTGTLEKVYLRWCRSLAAAGLIAVAVDFRNAYTDAAYNHFPAGLNDCAEAVKWIYANRDRLNLRNVILQGEGGGGNLAIATALKAKREGWVTRIDGVVAIAPYISNAYAWTQSQKLKELPSLVECHGYYLNVHQLAYLAYFYTPRAGDQTNPHAWPYHATAKDLQGLPPHVLTMDELDPLRDEGVSYARRLVEAGVSVLSRVNVGTVHGTSVVFRQAVPEFNRAAIREIASLAKVL